MGIKMNFFLLIMVGILVCVFTGSWIPLKETLANPVRVIVASDTILSGMITSLLPPNRYSIEAILPPGQCPGHYDVKLSDIEKMKKAYLIVSFRGMPFMNKTRLEGQEQLFLDTGGRNWMAPNSYGHGLNILAYELSKRFPEDQDEITVRREKAIREVSTESHALLERIKQAGIPGMAVIASSMQKDPLAWMGFRVVADYGRPEAISVREVVRLIEIGKAQQITMVVDNLQSGPDAGKRIAETLNVPHVVLTNFPSEKGYLFTLRENVNLVLTAGQKTKKR